MNASALTSKGFAGTTMSILSGRNGSLVTTNYGKKVNNDVNTAWTTGDPSLSSDVLNLSGMSKTLGSAKTDEYDLSLTYNAKGPAMTLANKGGFALLAKNVNGKWVNAITQNLGITEKFGLGPWTSSYKLDTYGVDPATNTAWAVLNYNGDFAVGQFPPATRR